MLHAREPAAAAARLAWTGAKVKEADAAGAGNAAASFLAPHWRTRFTARGPQSHWTTEIAPFSSMAFTVSRSK